MELLEYSSHGTENNQLVGLDIWRISTGLIRILIMNKNIN